MKFIEKVDAKKCQFLLTMKKKNNNNFLFLNFFFQIGPRVALEE